MATDELTAHHAAGRLWALQRISANEYRTLADAITRDLLIASALGYLDGRQEAKEARDV